MTDLEVAFDEIARRGVVRDADAVVDAALLSTNTTARPPRRSFALLMVAAAAVLVMATVTAAVYVRDRVDDIKRVDVAAALSDATPASGQPMTMLIVGVDRGVANSKRADVVMLARFDPTAHTIAFLSVPRDVRVRIPGTDRDDRLNTTFVAGATQLVDAVAATTGIRPDHYVEVDFAGFARLVDAVGGVEMQFAQPMRDQLSGLDVDAGCQTLDGETALAFVRARHVEIREPDGRYSIDPTGDLGRIQRQAALINSAIADIPTRIAGHPTRLNRVVDALSDALTFDSQFSVRDLVDDVRAFAQHPPARSFLVVPTTPIMLNNAALLEVDMTQLPSVVATFNSPPAAEATDGPAC